MLLNSIKWDLKLIVKYNILTIALIITSIYCIILYFSNVNGYEKLITILIFSDPVMYGYLFVAVMILFEKDTNTLQAIAVTPITTRHFFISKTISFTILALFCSSLIVFFSKPEHFNFISFFLAVVLSSSLFVFIGIGSVCLVKNFNQFILVIPIILAPIILPFIDFFGLYKSYFFYLIPSQACLILFNNSFSKVETWQLIYAISYLIIWNILSYKIALKIYKMKILKSNRNE